MGKSSAQSWPFSAQKLMGRRAIAGALFCSASLLASPALAVTVKADFTYGIVAEYTNNAQQPYHSVNIADLGAAYVRVTQESSTGQFGGNQGNDVGVGLTLYSDITSQDPSTIIATCQGSATWLDKSNTNTAEAIGFVISSCTGDGYNSTMSGKTYLLRKTGSTREYPNTAVNYRSTYIAADGSEKPLSGSADSREAVGFLNFEGGYTNDITPPVVAPATFSYNENQTVGAVVATVTATDNFDATVTNFIFEDSQTTISADGRYEITSAGEIKLTAAGVASEANDYEVGLNQFVYNIQATDAAGNRSLPAAITLNVLNVDDTFAGINGKDAITVYEGTINLETYTATEAVTWAIDGGTDSSAFSIDEVTGLLKFNAAPDYEAPTDADKNNVYLVRLKATDGGNNVTTKDVTVTVLNVDELGQKLAEISPALKTDLRRYAMHGLGDMLSFNETLVRASDDDDACYTRQKELAGRINASNARQDVKLQYLKQLNQCGRPMRILVDAALAISRFDGQTTNRVLGSVRLEHKFGPVSTIGVGVMGSSASDELKSFSDSDISDKSVQVNLYARTALGQGLRGGAFIGYGKAWYDFDLSFEGLGVTGDMTGRRLVYGAMISGDANYNGVKITTDAIVSRATERLKNANLTASYLGETRSNIAFLVGTVDTTRISIPLSGEFTLAPAMGNNRGTTLLLSPGLLCEDVALDGSSIKCGYQLGAKLNSQIGGRLGAYLDYRYESVSGLRRNMIGGGVAYLLGGMPDAQLAFDVDHGQYQQLAGTDSRAMLRLKLAH